MDRLLDKIVLENETYEQARISMSVNLKCMLIRFNEIYFDKDEKSFEELYLLYRQDLKKRLQHVVFD